MIAGRMNCAETLRRMKKPKSNSRVRLRANKRSSQELSRRSNVMFIQMNKITMNSTDGMSAGIAIPMPTATDKSQHVPHTAAKSARP